MVKLGTGRAAAINEADIAALADQLGCHPADLEAIAKVESSGFGWFADGRIKILFEKHWFYKLCPSASRGEAVKMGLARKSWISPAKGGYRDQVRADDRYRLLEQAMAINPEAALQSISIGKFQIMGFNHTVCGFASATAMWTAFLDSEVNQLQAFANFLKTNGLVAALRRRDFATIEKGYNGGGLNGVYARRMKAASDKLRAGRWKGYRPGSMATEPASADPRVKPEDKPLPQGEGSAPVPAPRPKPSPAAVTPATPPRPVAEASEPSPILRAIATVLGAVFRALFRARRRPNWVPDEDRAVEEREAGA